MMRFSARGLVLVSSLLLLGVSSPEDRKATDPKSIVSPANPAARPVPIDDLYFTRNVWGAAWSPDGKEIVFTTDITGRFNLWKVPVTGGWPIQLTQSDDVQSGAVWSPDGKWIVFHQDTAGNELHDLYAVPAGGGDVVNLTGTPDVREILPRFSPDGKRLAMMVKAKDAPVFDIALMDFGTRRVHRLTEEKDARYNWFHVAFSPDGTALYANRGEVSGSDQDVYRIDIATGKAENLTPHTGNVVYAASDVFPDGRTLLIDSSEKGGYENVALLDVATRKLTWVTDVKWEATARDVARDGRSFTYTINEDGRIDAYICERATLRSERLTLAPGLNTFPGRPTSFSPDGRWLLVTHESSQGPPDIHVYDTKERRARQLTFSVIASLNPSLLPEVQIVHYPSAGDRMISALVWMPFNLKRDGSNPAVVLPHGGPTWQQSDSWNPDAAALATRGYVCIAPNPRGSTGYGMEFQRANVKDLGGGDLVDVVNGAEFLKATGYVDPKRIGIFGGSYGGFMTLMALGKTPDVWAAGVSLYGIIDWFTMLKHSDPLLNQYLRALLGDPEKDRKVYEDASPIKYIRNAKAPLLVLQGDNDIRVPKEEAEQVVAILKKAGRTVDVHCYPNEGHGFAKRENQIDSIRRTVDWLDRYLKRAALEAK